MPGPNLIEAVVQASYQGQEALRSAARDVLAVGNAAARAAPEVARSASALDAILGPGRSVSAVYRALTSTTEQVAFGSRALNASLKDVSAALPGAQARHEALIATLNAEARAAYNTARAHSAVASAATRAVPQSLGTPGGLRFFQAPRVVPLSFASTLRPQADAAAKGLSALRDRAGELSLVLGTLAPQAAGAANAITGVAAASRIAGSAGVAAGVGILAAAAAVGALAAGIHETRRLADLAEDLDKLSQRTGLSTRDLQGLGLALKDLRVPQEALSVGLRFLNRNVSEGDPLLAKLGITAKDTRGALFQLSDLFARTADGTNKTAIAVAALGRGGDQLIPVLNQGSAALAGYADKADLLGITLSGETTKGALAADKAFDSLSNTLEGARNRIASGILPAVVELIPKIERLVQLSVKPITFTIDVALGITDAGEKFERFKQGLIFGTAAVIDQFSRQDFTLSGAQAAVTFATGFASRLKKEPIAQIGPDDVSFVGPREPSKRDAPNIDTEGLKKAQEEIKKFEQSINTIRTESTDALRPLIEQFTTGQIGAAQLRERLIAVGSTLDAVKVSANQLALGDFAQKMAGEFDRLKGAFGPEIFRSITDSVRASVADPYEVVILARLVGKITGADLSKEILAALPTTLDIPLKIRDPGRLKREMQEILKEGVVRPGERRPLEPVSVPQLQLRSKLKVPDPGDFTQSIGDFINQLREFNDAALESSRIAKTAILSVADGLSKGFGDVLTGLFGKTQTWGSAVKTIFKSVRDAVLKYFAEILQAEVTKALHKLFLKIILAVATKNPTPLLVPDTVGGGAPDIAGESVRREPLKLEAPTIPPLRVEAPVLQVAPVPAVRVVVPEIKAPEVKVPGLTVEVPPPLKVEPPPRLEVPPLEVAAPVLAVALPPPLEVERQRLEVGEVRVPPIAVDVPELAVAMPPPLRVDAPVLKVERTRPLRVEPVSFTPPQPPRVEAPAFDEGRLAAMLAASLPQPVPVAAPPVAQRDITRIAATVPETMTRNVVQELRQVTVETTRETGPGRGAERDAGPTGPTTNTYNTFNVQTLNARDLVADLLLPGGGLRGANTRIAELESVS